MKHIIKWTTILCMHMKYIFCISQRAGGMGKVQEPTIKLYLELQEFFDFLWTTFFYQFLLVEFFPKGPENGCVFEVLSTCEYIRLNWISNRHRVQFSIKNLLGLFSYRDVKTLLGTLPSPQDHGLIGSWLRYGILDYISLSRSGLE